MRSTGSLAGPKTRRRDGFGVKCAILHMIVIGGLFLMPGGCPPPPGGVTLSATTSGQGSVACNPDSATYDLNTQVTLTATPESGWTFDHWQGDLSGSTNPATLTMDADKSVTAVFTSLLATVEWTQTDISADTTIPAGSYLVNDSITVHDGATLTISPGTTLQFADGCYLWVESDGALNAAGTSDDPIVLTGQSNTPGYWTGVRFVDSNSVDNILQYVTIEYGGANYGGVVADLYIAGTSRVAVSHCTLRNSSGLGFVFHDDSIITFANNVTTANATGAGEVEPWLVGVLTTTSTFTNNTHDILQVRSDYTSVDQTWSALGVDYMLEGSLTVDKHTTIAPGVRLVFGSNDYLWVKDTGSLTANGTAADPIVITATNNSAGYWIGVRFVDSNSVNNSLQYVTIEYGGANYGGDVADLYLTGTSRLDMQHCTIRNSSGWGIWPAAGTTLTESGTTYASNASGNKHP